VKEERRLGVDNQPYGRSYEKLDELVYDNFAYKHSVIGSMADLDAASVEDVKEFFRIYYAPNNAVLALVGDLNTKETLAKVRKYFNSVPRQEQPKPVDLSETPAKGERRERMEDKLARLGMLTIAYRIPPATAAEAPAFSALGTIFGQGESSRLYQKLVKEKELCSNISAFGGGRMGPGTFTINCMVRPGKSIDEAEALISEEVAKLHAEPVTEKELQRAHVSARRSAVGMRTSALNRAISLADNAVLYNDPNRINTLYEKIQAVKADDIQKAVRAYLRNDNRVVMQTLPASAPAKPGVQ
jgi:predicted Zn-dependent peptidase